MNTSSLFPTILPVEADAYTIPSSLFESPDAINFSAYFTAVRKSAHAIDPLVYQKGDERMIFYGMTDIIHDVLSKPVTRQDIILAREFFKGRLQTMKGYRDMEFPEDQWMRIIDDFGGRLPIQIEALPEGSVMYRNEFPIKVTPLVAGFGCIAAHLEAAILNVFAASERATYARHLYQKRLDMIVRVESNNGQHEVDMDFCKFLAGISVHDFGMRSHSSPEEAVRLGMAHLLSFTGTDTFSAAYRAFLQGADPSIGTTVFAHAHRTVGGYNPHYLAYEAMYNIAKPNDILSMVADLYDYKNDVEKYILPLALRSVREGTNIVCVARPDSGDIKEQTLWTARLAVANGLYTTNPKNGLKYMTTLRVIAGGEVNSQVIDDIDNALLAEGFAPHGVLVYGIGGALRNMVSRDHFSWKYYLAEVGTGQNRRDVVKISNTPGKRTLPPSKISRDPGDMASGITIVSEDTDVDNPYVVYYNGLTGYMKPHENFMTIRDRVLNEFDIMPLTGGLVSQDVLERQSEAQKRMIDAATR